VEIPVRVVGYVREAPDPREGEPAFAQFERVRRWAADGGHLLVAVCQDLRSAESPRRREGLRALIGIVEGGAAQAVIVPDLSALSSDKVVQEIIIRDLRARGAVVISADDSDHPELDERTTDRVRMVVRDVLLRVDEHERLFAEAAGSSVRSRDADDDLADVVVELIAPDDEAEPADRIRPVR
jgi:DNA invertase Pin-like site-specific DNA recombinase